MTEHDAPQFSQHNKVTAHGISWTVKDLSRSRHCLVTPTKFYNRVKSIWPDCDPPSVEAALCFPQDMWRYFHKHGYITDAHLEFLIDAPAELTGMAARVASLSVTQRQVLGLSMVGWSIGQIAQRSELAPCTVTAYRHNIKRRLGITGFDDPALEDPHVHALIEPAFTAPYANKGTP